MSLINDWAGINFGTYFGINLAAVLIKGTFTGNWRGGTTNANLGNAPSTCRYWVQDGIATVLFNMSSTVLGADQGSLKLRNTGDTDLPTDLDVASGTISYTPIVVKVDGTYEMCQAAVEDNGNRITIYRMNLSNFANGSTIQINSSTVRFPAF
jgi:hypothetical protein